MLWSDYNCTILQLRTPENLAQKEFQTDINSKLVCGENLWNEVHLSLQSKPREIVPQKIKNLVQSTILLGHLTIHVVTMSLSAKHFKSWYSEL